MKILFFLTVKSKVIMSLFDTVRLSVSISPRNLYNSLKSIKESICSQLLACFFFFFIYIFFLQYEAIHPTDEGIFVHRSGTVKRRFREFVNLQARLEDNPLFKKSMKGLTRMSHFL